MIKIDIKANIDEITNWKVEPRESKPWILNGEVTSHIVQGPAQKGDYVSKLISKNFSVKCTVTSRTRSGSSPPIQILQSGKAAARHPKMHISINLFVNELEKLRNNGGIKKVVLTNIYTFLRIGLKGGATIQAGIYKGSGETSTTCKDFQQQLLRKPEGRLGTAARVALGTGKVSRNTSGPGRSPDGHAPGKMVGRVVLRVQPELSQYQTEQDAPPCTPADYVIQLR